MTANKEALRNGIKQTALLRSKLRGTSYLQEVMKLKSELEEKILRDNQKMEEKDPTSQHPPGFDPELYTMGVELAAAYIDEGIKTIDGFAKKMLDTFGPDIKPYIKSIYSGARHFPGVNNTGMTSYEEVNKINLDDIEVSSNPPNISGDVKRKPVRIESGIERTNSEIQDNQAPIQPTSGPNRPSITGPDSEIPAILPSSEARHAGGLRDDVVPGDIASLFR